MTQHSTPLHIKSISARVADMCTRWVTALHKLPRFHVVSVCVCKEVHGWQQRNQKSHYRLVMLNILNIIHKMTIWMFLFDKILFHCSEQVRV